MTLKMCYESMNADYDDLMRRLGRETLAQRLLLMFPRDSSFADLSASMEAHDFQSAFRAAHSLKGVALNLSLTPLSEAAIKLTDALRNGEPAANTQELFECTVQAYANVISAIKDFADNQST